jgi:hypothetical protein
MDTFKNEKHMHLNSASFNENPKLNYDGVEA